ncbi:MAG: Ig-like domain-containing protein [Clostridia bacterium]|nr:Ig-like domain-containing protein [Clostridia bacterium]
MKKKITAVLLFAVLLMNMSSAFAKWEVAQAPLPEVGILFQDDMEGYTTIESARAVNGGGWNRNLFLPGTFNNTTMLYYPAELNNTVVKGNFWSISEGGNIWGYGENMDLNTGKMKFEYKVYIPEEGGTLQEGERYFYYLEVISAAGWNDPDGTKEQANLSSVELQVGAKPIIGFAEKSVVARHNDYTETIEFDTPYTVTTIVDYDAQEVSHYLDGVLKATYKDNSVVPVKTAYKFNYFYPVIQFSGMKQTNSKICIDDVLVERMSGAGVMSASVGEIGENYVDVKFSDVISGEAADFNTNEFSLNAVGATDGVHPTSIEKISGGSTLRLTFADAFEAGETYELSINAMITSAFNKNASLPAGTILLFNIPVEQQETVLVDMSFDDYTFPTDEATSTAGDMTLFASTVRGEDWSTGSYTEGTDHLYAYISEAADENGGKMMKFECPENMLEWGGHSISLKIPFAEGQTVTDGTLTVEFEAAVGEGTHQWVDYSFGLSDKLDTSMEYSYTNRWANADLYAGLSYDSASTKFFVHGRKDMPSRNWGGGNSDFKTGHITAIGNGGAIENGTTMHKYKFVIDLDNKSYDIYYDGRMVQSLDYLPGSKTQMEYDAFVFAKNFFSKTNIYRKDQICIDNIKVTKMLPAPAMVNEVKFKKYDGATYGYSRKLSAGLTSAEVEFSKEMDNANITVEGLNEADYSVALNEAKTKAVVTFANCLSPDTDYAVVIGADSTDADGKPIAKGARYSFTTDSGEIIYGKPVIKCNGNTVNTIADITAGGTLTAEIAAVNTTAEKTGAFVTLVAHKNNTLVYATALEYAPEDGAPRVGAITLTAEDAAACAGADAVKVFVFDNLTDMKPFVGAEIVK